MLERMQTHLNATRRTCLLVEAVQGLLRIDDPGVGASAGVGLRHDHEHGNQGANERQDQHHGQGKQRHNNPELALVGLVEVLQGETKRTGEP